MRQDNEEYMNRKIFFSAKIFHFPFSHISSMHHLIIIHLYIHTFTYSKQKKKKKRKCLLSFAYKYELKIVFSIIFRIRNLIIYLHNQSFFNLIVTNFT